MRKGRMEGEWVGGKEAEGWGWKKKEIRIILIIGSFALICGRTSPTKIKIFMS